MKQTQRSMTDQPDICLAGMSETGRRSIRRRRRGRDAGASSITARRENSTGEGMALLEQVIARENMTRAYAQVVGNKGAAGIDEMTVDELKPYLHAQWERIKAELLNGAYRVQAVRAVEIPKPNDGIRQLGIPTVLDRLIQQALHQVLSPIFEPHFSKHSYGFRPRRSAHQAVVQARQYVAEGKRWVVDIDLSRRGGIRPCQSRYSDVPHRTTREGQEGIEVDTAVPASRHSAGWCRQRAQ